MMDDSSDNDELFGDSEEGSNKEENERLKANEAAPEYV